MTDASAPEPKVCPRCGATVPGDARFCSVCWHDFQTEPGTKIGTADVNATVLEHGASNETDAPSANGAVEPTLPDSALVAGQVADQPRANEPTITAAQEATVISANPTAASTVVGSSTQDVAPYSPAVPNRFWAGRLPLQSRRIAFGAAGLLILLVATSAWGFVGLQDSNRSREALNAARAELAMTRSDLEAATSRAEAAEARASALSECVSQWESTAQEGQALLDLEEQRFALWVSGSVWSAADLARDAALIGAKDDYYQAYSQAFAGNLTKASEAIKAGNAKVAVANTNNEIMTGEIAKIDGLGGQINPRSAALAATIDQITSCSD